MLEANNINEKGDKFESDFLKNNLEIRSYQIKISDKCINNNSLVVLPTGLGKTIIAIIVAAKTLDNYPPTSKIIVLAPTRPLIDQHFRIFGKHLKISEEKLCILTGNIKPENRIDLFNKNQFLFYTPQTLRNDLVNRRYTLKNVCLIIFDECHHAFGNYPYTFIADEYNDQNPDGTILALTASPGASKERIRKLCYNLHIPLQNIYKRMREDTDVRIYIKDLEIIKIGVKPTDLMERFYEILRLMIEERLKYLSQLNFIEVKSEKLFYRITRKDLINLNKKLVNTLNSNAEKAGSYSAISVNAQILILYHMIELIEQQGLDILMCYLEEMNKKAKKNNSSKAIKMLANENRLRQIYILLKKSQETTPENLIHPKYKVLEQLIIIELKQKPESKILVFVKLRDSVRNIVDKLDKCRMIKPIRFVGQASKSNRDKGLSQKQQINILQKFKEGFFNTLVSTNVGEEGLDVAECDLVIFYDVVASEIRLIQRRGRTARHREGKVIILFTENTNEEKYLTIALNKVNRMKKNLGSTPNLKEDLIKNKNKQYNLQNFINGNITKKSNKLLDEKPSIKISKIIPMNFGLRKQLNKNGLKFETISSNYHVVLFEKILIQIYNPNGLSKLLLQKIENLVLNARKKFQLIINIVDFTQYKESVEGEKRLLKQKIQKFSKNYDFRIICVDNLEELIFIIKSILDTQTIIRDKL